MATLVKCTFCGVLTYAQPAGDGCHSCNQGTMEPYAQAAPVNASAFGVDQPDNPVHVPQVDPGPAKGPKVTGRDGADLWQLLADGQFHKAKDIEMESRKIRAICAVYPNQFLSTQQGYKRVKNATDDEMENAIKDLRSRMGHLNRRASALEKVLRDRNQPGLDI